jgi:metal-responsive CopG/Arc/MetJ family transcriptional regulator
MVVKINVSIAEKVLKELDQAAHESGTSRSALLTKAAELLLEERAREKALQLRRQAAQEIDRIRESVPPWDATAAVLEWRAKH